MSNKSETSPVAGDNKLLQERTGSRDNPRSHRSEAYRADAKESLAGETETVHIPPAELSLPEQERASAVQTKILQNRPIALAGGNDSLPSGGNELVALDQPLLLDLNRDHFSYINPPNGRAKVVFDLRDSRGSEGATPLLVLRHQTVQEYEEAFAQTQQAISTFLNYVRDTLGLTEATVAKYERSLTLLFTLRLFYDEKLRLFRTITVAEFLWPDYGHRIFRVMKRIVGEDFGEGVVADLFGALRVFLRYLCDVCAVLDDGVNLREEWGPIACAVNDREVPKRKRKPTDLELPRPSQLPVIYEETLSWSERAKTWRAEARQTATLFIASCESGKRGVESRDELLAEQCLYSFWQTGVLPNPFNTRTAKGGNDRLTWYEPYGHAVVGYYLREWRTELTDDIDGWIYPKRGGGQLSSSAFAKRTGRLLHHLKERGLLHSEFTFHTTRKVFTTRFIESGGDLGTLTRQLGHKDPTMIAAYWIPTVNSIAEQRRRFASAWRRAA